MGGWVDGWMGGWVKGWMGEGMDGWMGEGVDGWMGGWGRFWILDFGFSFFPFRFSDTDWCVRPARGWSTWIGGQRARMGASAKIGTVN